MALDRLYVTYVLEHIASFKLWHLWQHFAKLVCLLRVRARARAAFSSPLRCAHLDGGACQLDGSAAHSFCGMAPRPELHACERVFWTRYVLASEIGLCETLAARSGSNDVTGSN
eukprot:6184131-Pleurochrysis_carterae.AAC.2